MHAGAAGCWVDARAKVNLTLEVLGKRPDGFHELRSVVMPVELADRVEIRVSSAAGDVSLETVADGVALDSIGPDEANLACRAAVLVRGRFGVDRGVAIRLVKRIPVGGGLGGGSADAAAVLIGLDHLWGLRLSRLELAGLGAELGSDVPAQVHGGAVCVRGRGEHVTPLLTPGDGPAAAFWLVLANPGVAVSTAEVYRHCKGGLTGPPHLLHTIASSVRTGDVCGLAAALFNGLEPCVFGRYPETARLARGMRAAGALAVLLCGSGASVLAVVADEAQGWRVRSALADGVWSVVTRTLPDGVMAAHGPLEP